MLNWMATNVKGAGISGCLATLKSDQEFVPNASPHIGTYHERKLMEVSVK